MANAEQTALVTKLEGINFSEVKGICVEIVKLLAEKGLTFRQAEGVLDYTKDLLKDVQMQKFQC